jgi:hypothetical protein
LHLHDHGGLLVHSLEKEHVVRPQLFEHAGAAMGEVAVGDNQRGPRREQEPRSSEEHGEELRLVAQDLDDGLVLETWHEIRMPPPSDIPAPLPGDYRTAFLAVANYVDSQLSEWHVIANGN